MAGKRQHYVPRFLQRGFLAEPAGKAELTWLHRRDTASRLVSIKDVGVEEFFYSKLGEPGESTLDDLITFVEGAFDADLRTIKQASPGSGIDAAVPARLITHLLLRAAHVRSIFEKGAAQLLDQISMRVLEPNQLRDLIGLDTDFGVEEMLEILGDDVRGQPFEDLVAHPLVGRLLVFLVRESFDEIFSAQQPQMVDILSKLKLAVPTMIRDAHNNALRTADQTRWELDLAELSWRTQGVVGAILPDCIALAVSGINSFTPLSLKEREIPNTIIFPIAHNLLLVGSKDEPVELGVDAVNAASAACCDSFFIARRPCDSMGLNSLIGQRCALVIKAVVEEALEGVLPRRLSMTSAAVKVAPRPSAGQMKTYSFSLTCHGFADIPTAQRIADILEVVVRELSRDLPLDQLDGVTFATGYGSALEKLDRGDSTLGADGMLRRTYGNPVAKCVDVVRNAQRKSHIVFDAVIAVGLLEEDICNRDWALQVLVSMLSNVAHEALYEGRLRALAAPVEAMAARMTAATSAAPSRYFAARTSAFADPKAGERYATLFLESLISANQEIHVARQAYLNDGVMDRLLDVALLHISFALAHAAEWLGHRDGLPAHAPFPGSGLPDDLVNQGLKNWLELFGRDLRALYDEEDQFTYTNIFALSRHAERILWTTGMFPWPLDDGRLYVALGTPIPVTGAG